MEIIELLYETNELELKDIRRLGLIRKAKVKFKTLDFLSSIVNVHHALQLINMSQLGRTRSLFKTVLLIIIYFLFWKID